jgi:D-beta-D-heptose 7-phosphate kinase/D-beta-D-heptose 1-phosphate adenosyltransferase
MTIELTQFSRCQVLVIGDLMLDEYIWGDVERISPEAPVQVVSVKNEEHTLGGAGNVINNLVALGARVSAVSVIGSDIYGQQLLEMLSRMNVDAGGIIVEPDRPTTRKTRVIAANQHVVRIDRETTERIHPDTYAHICAFIEQRLPEMDVVLISDYNKGLISAELVSSIAEMARRHGKVTIGDPKGLDFSKYAGLTLLTPNKKEASLASGIDIADEHTLHQAAKTIISSASLQQCLITCGKDGMVLFEPGAEPQRIHARAKQVYDVSGAGDTVLSILGLAIAGGATFKEAAALANTAAGIVVGKVGTATVSAEELGAAIAPKKDIRNSKHIPLSEINSLVSELRRSQKKIVLTNGCFDLLHIGHIRLFGESKAYGDVLFVAIDDDQAVRSLKGADRPVISAQERVRILSALDSVDYVVVFSEGELPALLESVKPDVLTKGSDYTTAKVVGGDIVENHGGRVALIPIIEEISSTCIINNIKKHSHPH